MFGIYHTYWSHLLRRVYFSCSSVFDPIIYGDFQHAVNFDSISSNPPMLEIPIIQIVCIINEFPQQSEPETKPQKRKSCEHNKSGQSKPHKHKSTCSVVNENRTMLVSVKTQCQMSARGQFAFTRKANMLTTYISFKTTSVLHVANCLSRRARKQTAQLPMKHRMKRTGRKCSFCAPLSVRDSSGGREDGVGVWCW